MIILVKCITCVECNNIILTKKINLHWVFIEKNKTNLKPIWNTKRMMVFPLIMSHLVWWWIGVSFLNSHCLLLLFTNDKYLVTLWDINLLISTRTLSIPQGHPFFYPGRLVLMIHHITLWVIDSYHALLVFDLAMVLKLIGVPTASW